MDRLNALLVDEELKGYFHRLKQLEQNRIYCRHGLSHCLDVARIGYILLLEEQDKKMVSKELFYAAALVHDLGRVEQYTHGTPHDEVGVQLAERLLGRHGFTGEETAMVCHAIKAHRHLQTIGQCASDRDILAHYLYRGDKLSRNCFDCEAADSCKWSDERRNTGIYW